MREQSGHKYRLLPWLVIYEAESLLVMLTAGLLELLFGHPHPVESIAFILSRSPVEAALSIWLSNLSSFFLGGVLVVVSPFLGALSVAAVSASQADLLASLLAGHCPPAHFAYGIAETQAYILLWTASLGIYFEQKSCRDLECRWRATTRYLARILPIATLCFLALSVVEVAEVHVYG